MEDDGPTASITFVILLMINLVIYGFRTAMEYVNEKEVERKAEEEKDKSSIRLMKLLNSPKECRNMIQFVLLFLHVFMGYFCIDKWLPGLGRWLMDVFGRLSWKISPEITGVISAILAFVILLYAVMIFGVLVPGKLAKTWPDKWIYTGISFL